MSYGILEEPCSRALFEEINWRPCCDDCQLNRSDFKTKDKKEHNSFSNLLPGFSSLKISRQIDILIVGDSHGGGESESFRPQKDLGYEVSQIGQYYRSLSLKTFHQQQVRILLDRLDNMGREWVFTDLIKCFVWHGKENELKGSKNRKIAIKHCGKYLEEQIVLLKPRNILGLGNTVAQYFGLDKPEHGSIHRIRTNNYQAEFVHSLFPTQWTADSWVAKDGWKPVIRTLVE